MAKAREIHKTNIRTARAPKLAELDVDFQKAQETSADTSAIVAKKDVPTGKKYKIISDSDVPTDRSFRDAWTVNEANLTDGVGA